VSLRILSLAIVAEVDVVASRQRARQIGALCGFGSQDQTRIATAVSELARNVYSYAGSGRIEFSVEGATAPQLLVIRVEDQGPGIPDLPLVLSGRYQSSTGMGMGILGARRLMDQCDVSTAPGKGTVILLKKLMPADAPLLTAAAVGALGAELHALPPGAALSEMQQQNKELLATLAELNVRQEELLKLTRELEDTNRGVVALYAELDQQAEHLRGADEMKTRFLSNMSHEFRTPLNSIRALSKLLLDRTDGELGGEQEKQVGYILKSADALAELVDDLLDLAKIEAGKIDIRAEPFDVADMFSALRGMLRPLLVSAKVELVFDMPEQPLLMVSDEGKVSQILRNFISNALKFTEAGQVRVSAELLPDGAGVRFAVQDTGIGIAAEDQQLIFEEFSQVPSHLQRSAKGTGLGLPLCRKLAALLGGRVGLSSTPGEGSTFFAALPLRLRQSGAAGGTGADGPAPAGAPAAALAASGQAGDGGIPVLVIEDDRTAMLLYRSFFRNTPYRAVWARSLWEAEQIWDSEAPAAVILDLYLNGTDAWRWLTQTKNDERRRHVPVIIASEVADRQKAYSLGADAYFVKPVPRTELLAQLNALYLSASGSGAPPSNLHEAP
jgi:signal transduction histidine kinase/ActR/RegA family two-component response regulator